MAINDDVKKMDDLLDEVSGINDRIGPSLSEDVAVVRGLLCFSVLLLRSCRFPL